MTKTQPKTMQQKTAKPINKGGRPLSKIDWNQFDKLCEIQCTMTEIADFFGVSIDTIRRACKREHGVGFATHYKTKSAPGKISLRRAQIKYANKGNAQLLIWLGRQMLEQKDKQEHVHTGNLLSDVLSEIDGKTKSPVNKKAVE